MGLFPCSQGIEYQEGIFSGGWVGKLFESGGEGGCGGFAGIKLVGEELEVLEMWIERVRRAFMTLKGENRGLALGGVGPGGLGLVVEIGWGWILAVWENGEREGFELV